MNAHAATYRNAALLFDWAFTLASAYFFVNGQLTNGLLCWGISEIYSLRRRVEA